MTAIDHRRLWSPADFCRLDESLCLAIRRCERQARVLASACIAIALCAFAYGFVFGVWRAPLQGLYSALKMPIPFFATVLSSALINTALAQVQGGRISFVQVCQLMLYGMTVTTALMAALSPVIFFFAHQVTAPPLLPQVRTDPAVTHAYHLVLVTHVAVIAVAGTIGQVKLYHLLRQLTATSSEALWVLFVWLGVVGFVGSQWSWLLSPFLCAPEHEPHMIARYYFDYNFYEYVWMALSGKNG